MINEDNFDSVMQKYNIPESLHGGLQRYFFDRIEPGSFLRAVLENNLVDAFVHADENNRYELFHLASFIYSELPDRTYSDGPWGSKQKVERWLELGQERPVW